MDHLSLTTVVAAAKLFLSNENTLHGLINNAGIMATPFEMSNDGHEAQWQTNYLAHWLFTYHLLPVMISTSKTLPAGAVRIVNVSSSGHYSAPNSGINFTDTTLSSESGMTRYGQSKLANILHAKRLDELYGPDSASSKSGNGEIWTSIVHPGLVDSQLGTHAEMPRILRAAFELYGAMGGKMDADKGSWTTLFCAASLDMTKKQSGTYFQRIAEPGWQSKTAKNMALANKLDEWTKDLMTREGWVDK
jgi:NAD(P)-dependent dehydrogenase (short-subunit alcohol dehydrogenase family)